MNGAMGSTAIGRPERSTSAALPDQAAGERLVYVVEGKTSTRAGPFYNRPLVGYSPTRHGDGTNFSFADGHAEYWKWQDQRTVKVSGGGQLPVLYRRGDNPDIQRVIRAAWGKLGYELASSHRSSAGAR
jgi:prepilin-type processing-associated H-X9-DG protein